MAWNFLCFIQIEIYTAFMNRTDINDNVGFRVYFDFTQI